MEQLTKTEVLAFIKKECSMMNGLFEYMDMALNDLSVLEVCTKYNITRTDLQWGKAFTSKLADMLKSKSFGLTDSSKLIECGDAVMPFYLKDTTTYSLSREITEEEIREKFPTNIPVSFDLVVKIITTALTPLDISKEFGFDYKTSWYIYRNVQFWAKYEATGTYINKSKRSNPCYYDQMQLCNWLVKKEFPLDVISTVKDIINNYGYVHSYQVPILEEVREVMYKECIIYRSSNNKGKIHWGDKWKPFYIELEKGKII